MRAPAWFCHRLQERIEFVDEEGNPLKLWNVRAGMLVAVTKYSHPGRLEVTMRKPSEKSPDAPSDYVQ